MLIAAIAPGRSGRDEIRRVVVGMLDELGVEDPLASSSRMKLASALY
jgi:thioredoxin-like negative regulator of GroEL